MAPGHSNGWGKALLDNIDEVATWGNNIKSRFLIISQQVEVDRNYVDQELKKNHKTNELIFDFYEMKDPIGTVQGQNEFINKFKEFDPTVVVLTYEHKTKGDGKNKLKQCPPGHAPRGSVAAILKAKRHFSKILLSHSNYLFMRTLNVWHREECILTSLTGINKKGVKEELENARSSGMLDNSEDTRVLVISGGHGGPRKNKIVTSAGGVSCFTNKDDLEYKFYVKDCEIIGVESEADICSYRQVNNEWVIAGVDQTGSKPKPEPKPKLNNPGSLCTDSKFDKISFDVLNIAHFGIYESASKASMFHRLAKYLFNRPTTSSNLVRRDTHASNIDKLIRYLEEYRPTFILIGWCFSSNGDLAMALRSRGFFSKLLMEHDLRIITKDPTAELSDQQVEVLRQVAAMDLTGKKPKYKNFHLVGSSGCGKTILGIEIVKIILAQLCQDLQLWEKVNLVIIVQQSLSKTPTELKKKLEEDLSLNDLVSSYPVIKNDVLLVGCLDIEELSEKIKETFSKISKAKFNVILLEEVSIKPEKVNGVLVQSFASMDKMKTNVRCVFAHSPVDLDPNSSNNVPFKVQLPKSPDVYTQHLQTRYRNNQQILQFLKFLASEGVYRNNTLVSDEDKDAVKLPPSLEGSLHHPVLWLECNWSWDDMNSRLTRNMVHSLVPDMDVFAPNQRMPVGVMVVWDEDSSEREEAEAGKPWRWVGRTQCAGLEEEVVVVVSAYLSYEAYGRARNQLLVITGTGLFQSYESLLNKAKDQGLLEKIVLNDKPDIIREK